MGSPCGASEWGVLLHGTMRVGSPLPNQHDPVAGKWAAGPRGNKCTNANTGTMDHVPPSFHGLVRQSGPANASDGGPGEGI